MRPAVARHAQMLRRSDDPRNVDNYLSYVAAVTAYETLLALWPVAESIDWHQRHLARARACILMGEHRQ